MKKITMNHATKQEILEIITNNSTLVIPDKVTITGYNSGTIDREKETPLIWGSLDCVSSEELELLQSVGLEENVNTIKIKLLNYDNENISNLVGRTFDTSNLEILFIEKRNGNRGNEIAGLAFRGNLSELKEVKS